MTALLWGSLIIGAVICSKERAWLSSGIGKKGIIAALIIAGILFYSTPVYFVTLVFCIEGAWVIHKIDRRLGHKD